MQHLLFIFTDELMIFFRNFGIYLVYIWNILVYFTLHNLATLIGRLSVSRLGLAVELPKINVKSCSRTAEHWATSEDR